MTSGVRPLVLSFSLLSLATLAGCGRSEAQGGPPMAPPVSAAPAVSRDVPLYDEFSGRLEAVETVEVRSRVAGTLQTVHFRDGQELQRGAPMFSIDARPFTAELARLEAQLASARNAAALADTEVVRTRKLLEQKAVSQQEADQAEAAARNAAAAVKAAGDMESLQLAMESQLGSAEAARKELELLRIEALKPGLGFEQAVRGSVALQSVGFSADKSRKIITEFGNALSIAGKGAAELDGVVTGFSFCFRMRRKKWTQRSLSIPARLSVKGKSMKSGHPKPVEMPTSTRLKKLIRIAISSCWTSCRPSGARCFCRSICVVCTCSSGHCVSLRKRRCRTIRDFCGCVKIPSMRDGPQSCRRR